MSYKILFLNQMAGPLFRQLAEDLSKSWNPSLLYTGHPDADSNKTDNSLIIKKGICYNRKNYFLRIYSWLRYFFSSIFIVSNNSAKTILFIVSNPPFLGLVGFLAKSLRKQKYIILVYDIYPDILISLGTIKKSFLSSLWDFLNKIILQNAETVITIGKDMAMNLENKYKISIITKKRIVSIAPWVDTEVIKPISKKDNWFCRQYGLVDKFTVIYSGNMGNAHNIEILVEAAKQLQNFKGIHFLLIGEGPKWQVVKRAKKKERLDNITLLPFQPEPVLPYSLTSADMGVVSYYPGTEGYMLPSKAFYYLSAGLALGVISDRNSDLTNLVKSYNCGLCLQNDDSKKFGQAIISLAFDKKKLDLYKSRAREITLKEYSRENTKKYFKLLKKIVKE